MNDSNAGVVTEFNADGFPVVPATDKENDNSSASSTGEKTTTEQTQSQEGETNSGADKKVEGEAGFADHPRWKQREEEWKTRYNEQETRHTNELQKFREEFEEKYGRKPDAQEVKEATADTTPEAPPAWFGGDEDAWKEYRNWHNSELSKAEQRGSERALKEFSSKGDAEQKAIKDATDFFNTEVSTLESDKELNPQGLKVDRNKLLKTALDNDLIDSKGRWNYKAAFKLMKPAEVFQAKAVLDEKKKIADASTSDQRTESKPEAFATSEDFRKDRPW